MKEEQFQKLKEELKERPADGGIWTGPKVARWIEKETGREKVWNQRGWDYLKKSRYSCQKPNPKHKKEDPVEQEKFKQNLPVKVQELRDKFSNSQIESGSLTNIELA